MTCVCNVESSCSSLNYISCFTWAKSPVWISQLKLDPRTVGCRSPIIGWSFFSRRRLAVMMLSFNHWFFVRQCLSDWYKPIDEIQSFCACLQFIKRGKRRRRWWRIIKLPLRSQTGYRWNWYLWAIENFLKIMKKNCSLMHLMYGIQFLPSENMLCAWHYI